MKKIKLSELDLRCAIVYGNKNNLACAEMLLYRIYKNKRLPRKNIALLKDGNYEIEIDIKKENIIEGFKCWVCDKYLGNSNDVECPDHPISKDENLAPEYIYMLKINQPKIYDKVQNLYKI